MTRKGDSLRILLPIAGIVGVMGWFCAMTPWIYDDFSYGSGDSSLAAVWAAQVHEHLTWSGKFVGHFLSRCLLHGPVWLHPVLSSLMFVYLVFCGALLTLGVCWRENLRAWHIIVLAGLVWLALPAFGTVFFGAPEHQTTAIR